MIAVEQIVALTVAQRRSFWNSLTVAAGRWGRVVSLVFGLIWYAVWGSAAIGVALVPWYLGAEDADINRALPGALFFVLLYWQLVPLITLSLGASLELKKVLIYPVAVNTLFVVECILRLSNGAEMVLVLLGLFGGLALAGSPFLPQLAFAFVLFIAMNVLLSAGLRNVIERLFQRRRLREAVFVFIVALTVLPQFLIWTGHARSFGRTLLEWGRSAPYWLTPSGLAARISVGDANLADYVAFLGLVALAAIFAYTQFQASIRLGSSISSAAAAGEFASNSEKPGLFERLIRVPARLLGDPVGALVEKEIRYLWRSPRFRLPFFLGFTFGVIAWIPLMNEWEMLLGDWMVRSAPVFISIYAFLLLGPVMFLNRFGFDRGAAKSYFWLPVPTQTLLIAKNLATVFFAELEALLVCLICTLAGLPVTVGLVVEVLVVCGVALFYLLAVGNHMSVAFPVASNPDRVSRAGGGHGLRAAVQFFLFPLSLLPIGWAYWVRYSGGGETQFIWWMGFAALLGVLLYGLTLPRQAARTERDREFLVGQLAVGDGAVSGE